MIPFPFKLSAGTRIGILAFAWLGTICLLHLVLNGEEQSAHRVRMGYMPVISNLAAPLLDFTSREDDLYFEAIKFSSFSEMGEAFRAGHIQAAFIIAPLALMLFEQGVPLKIVYIGNRHESTLVMRSGLQCNSPSDIAGKTIAVPLRYSGHLLALKRYMRENGLRENDVRIVEIPPPEMPVALAASQIDGYFVGEPFGSKALESGTGKRFLNVEDTWPKFICNLLIVRDELIRSHPDRVRKMVATAAASGLWAREHTGEAMEIVNSYWGQDPRVIRYAFSNPSGRFRFDLYAPVAEELEEMAREMSREGMLKKEFDGHRIMDDRFATAVSKESPAALQSTFTSRLESLAGPRARTAKQ